jgi:phosphoglycerate kinase
MAKLTVNDLNVQGQRVFVRVDYNVPLEEQGGKMVITDATRIVETLPTLNRLIAQGGKLILAAHLGRPKGQREPSMSLRPIWNGGSGWITPGSDLGQSISGTSR